MFGRDKLKLPTTQEYDVLQRADDQVTASRAMFTDTYNDAMLKEIHPWDLPDVDQLGLVFAGLAFAHDRTAESLIETAAATDKDGVTRATPDVVTFATAVSLSAQEHMMNARLVRTRFGESSFKDAGLTESLNPESQLPYWPYLDADRAAESWMGLDAHEVTVPFMLGIVAASRAIEAEVTHLLDNSRRFPTPVSLFYGTVEESIREGSLKPAAALLDSAERQLLGNDSLPIDIAGVTYNEAHEAYLRTSWALSCAAAPSLLGPDFVRQ